MREDQVANGLKFLIHPTVKTAPLSQRISFLENKVHHSVADVEFTMDPDQSMMLPCIMIPNCGNDSYPSCSIARQAALSARRSISPNLGRTAALSSYHRFFMSYVPCGFWIPGAHTGGDFGSSFAC